MTGMAMTIMKYVGIGKVEREMKAFHLKPHCEQG
jgi:hypothetical protein